MSGSELLIERPPLSHIEDPAAVLNFVNPCVIRDAPDVLEAFEAEVYGVPLSPDEPSQFRVAFIGSDVFGLVAVMVFPRTGIKRLGEICAEKGLVLVNGVLTAINQKTQEMIEFDVNNAVAGLTDTRPAARDIYTFGNRPTGEVNNIICGPHRWEIPTETNAGAE